MLHLLLLVSVGIVFTEITLNSEWLFSITFAHTSVYHITPLNLCYFFYGQAESLLRSQISCVHLFM